MEKNETFVKEQSAGQAQKDVVQEKVLKPISGMFMLVTLIVVLIATVVGTTFGSIWLAGGASQYEVDTSQVILGSVTLGVSVLIMVLASLLFVGLKIVRPNEAVVLLLFGKYYGTIKKAGMWFVNPFAASFNPARADVRLGESPTNFFGGKKISLKAVTLDNGIQKINDLDGNPIEISVNVVWKILNTAYAVFSVDNYAEYISTQADLAVRNVARLYPYDVSVDGDEKSLRGSSIEIAEELKKDLQARVEVAGIEIVEARISHLAYAQEIAAAMLQRQQANAVVAARQKIVEGAVSMVEMALEKLEANKVVKLDNERKATMISNLLVVLCGNRDAQPVVNSGSIY
ncbi:MAG: SPFH domain-containing protein [Firmicutes bacterium]|nr:SPFH domain-containing protein [Bacillota bacterium]